MTRPQSQERISSGFGARSLAAGEFARPSNYALGRAVGALALALAVAVLPGVGEHRFGLVIFLVVVLAPLMWAIEHWAGPRGLHWTQSALDVGLCVLFAQVLSEHWTTIALIGVLVVTANLMHLQPFGYLALLGALCLGLGIAAVDHGVERGGLSVAVVFTIGIPVAAYSQWLRSRERQAMAQVDDMTHSVAAIVWEAHADTGRIRHLIGPTEEVTGHSHAEFAARYPDELVHPEDRFTHRAELPADGTRVERTLRMQHVDGRWLWIREVVGRVVVDHGGDSIRGVAMDITDLAESGEELRKRAEQDTLTGLMNRATIVDEIRRRLASAAPVGILLIDLDGFKSVNDTMGHLVGDRLLTVQARRLEAVARRDDAVGRLGGDEFVVVSSAVGAQALVALAHRIVSALDQPVSLDGVEVGCSASLGVAWTPDHGVTHDELMRHADEAMYRAKRGGLGVQSFDQQPDHSHAQRIDRLEQLSRSLEDELELWFQPIVDASTLKTSAVEGLVRWRHPVEGMLAPLEFLDLVESSGLTARFDAHVMTLGVRHAAFLAGTGTPTVVAVNITQRGLSDRSFARRFRELMEAHGVAPSLMALEISERSVDDDQRALLETLAELRDIGVRIALDDFGTGFSSLTRLRQLPITEIKIDRSFVSAMVSSPADEIIVRSTIEMARELGLGVIAEGVADEATLFRLQELGCGQLQGFLFAPATPTGERIDELAAPLRVPGERAESTGPGRP